MADTERSGRSGRSDQMASEERVGRVNDAPGGDLADPHRRGTVEEAGTVNELDERGGAVAGGGVGVGLGAAAGAVVGGPVGALVGGAAAAAAGAAAGALGAASQTGDPADAEEHNDKEVPGANPQRPLSDAERVHLRTGIGGGT